MLRSGPSTTQPPGFDQQNEANKLRYTQSGQGRASAGNTMPETVIIVDYDPAWPEIFAALRRRIKAALAGRSRPSREAGGASDG